MISTWGFYIFMEPTFPKPEKFSPDTCQGTYDRYMDLWVRCEQWGFDGLAFAEHHFSSLNLSPSPNLLVAAVAARTSTLRFTTLGAVLPMYDPRRYIEECGMLEYLTHGRFEPGIAPGAGPIEAIKSGIPAEKVRPRYDSGSDLLEKALTNLFVTHQDEFSNIEDLPILPKMRMDPSPTVWVTVMSAGSAASVARRGWKACTAWSSIESVTEFAENYRDAAEDSGHSTAPDMLGVRRRVFVAPTDAEALEICESMGNPIRQSAGTTFETQDDTIRSRMNHPDDYAVGSPETVAEKLIEQCRTAGLGNIMAFPDFLTFSHEHQIRSHELIGTRVAPMLRSANVGGGDRVATTATPG